PLRSRLADGLPLDLPDNPFTHTGMDQPSLSDDGRFLAFRSTATSNAAVPGWSTGPVEGAAATAQVYVWEIDDDDPFTAIRLVSTDVDGAPSTAGAADPALSRDGTVAVFTSADQRIVPEAVYPACEANCPEQVFAVDRDAEGDGLIDGPGAERVVLVSALIERDDLGERVVAGTSSSSQPAVSGNGQLVAFTTKAANLQLVQVPGVGSGPDGDLLLAHLERRTLERLTVGPDDGVVPTAGVHARPDLSDTGRTVVFDSAAADRLTGQVLDVTDAEPDADAESDESAADAEDLDDTRLPGRRVVARSLPPQLSLPDADLGTTLVGLESDEWYVAVINDGPSSFLPAEVTISGSEFVVNPDASTCLLGASVPAGGDCTVAFSYTPGAAQVSTATLRVAEAGFDAVAIESTIAGAGGEPTLKIEPAGADLGVVTVGESSVELRFDIENTAPIVPTSLSQFEIAGAHAADFEFTSNDCLDRPLNPRATCSVGITFRPTDAGRRTALVTIGTPSGQYTTMVIAGDGRFEPVVQIARAEVETGDNFIVTGQGFEAEAEVTLVFGDDPTDVVVATTDADGDVFVSVPVSARERDGLRPIVVQSANGTAASSTVEVRSDDRPYVGMPGFGLG
ncbi:MAG: choice-of-anchor D domain-containing protein, partial [Actinomycetota bacterium]